MPQFRTEKNKAQESRRPELCDVVATQTLRKRDFYRVRSAYSDQYKINGIGDKEQ